MTAEIVYSTQSTRWDCTCPPGQDVDWWGHDEDCPENAGEDDAP